MAGAVFIYCNFYKELLHIDWKYHFLLFDSITRRTVLFFKCWNPNSAFYVTICIYHSMLVIVIRNMRYTELHFVETGVSLSLPESLKVHIFQNFWVFYSHFILESGESGDMHM